MKRRLLLAATLAAPFPARAQPGFPTRSARIVSGVAPGGATDVLARLMADRLGPIWRQPVVVENRTGAGGFGIRAADPAAFTAILAEECARRAEVLRRAKLRPE